MLRMPAHLARSLLAASSALALTLASCWFGPPAVAFAAAATPCTDCGTPVMLDIGVVGSFMEPASHDEICSAGALRVVLAIAGRNRDFRAAGWQDDAFGTGYMMYLADKVSVKGLRRVGLENGTVGATMRDVQLVANWEYSDEGRDAGHRYSSTYPFRATSVSGETLTRFERDIERMIRTDGIPVYVATRTSSLKGNVGLPSWDINAQATGDFTMPWTSRAGNDYYSLSWGFGGKWTDGGHAIAVVGYDKGYYYYIDTCYRSTACRAGPNDLPGRPGFNFTGNTVPNTWRIPKDWLYGLMLEWAGGGAYLDYLGAPVAGDPAF
jgi:hypothetical protein